MNMAETVPTAEYARNFGRHQLQARKAVPVSSTSVAAELRAIIAEVVATFAVFGS